MRRRAEARGALAVAVLAGLAGAGAPGPAQAEPVLHEYVKPPRTRAGRIVGGEPAGAARPGGADPAGPGRDGQGAPGEEERRENPPAIRQDDRILVQPQVDEPPRPSELRHGDPGASPEREREARPDYLTHADGTLHYAEVWNPSIVPFKRMSVLDGVRDDYTLVVADGRARRLPGAGDTSTDRDLFWGSLVVDLPPGGKPVPIPSVAPDMRVLSYESQPAARLEFSRDGADNFSVRATDRAASGPHRLVFLVDAAATYFAPRIPPEVTLPQIAAARAAAPLPPRVQRAARQVLERIGVMGDDPAATTLDKLVAYFRAFEAGAPPSPTGDVYLDLALSQRGVCRHRAFAFVITALAVGIPARYVTNEAHAFAEVWLPENGWARVDLGGAALELEIANASDKVMHRPRGPDPFPKPRAYAENYTRLRGPVAGLSSEQLADAQRPLGAAGPSDDPTSTEPVTPGVTDLPVAGAASGPAEPGRPSQARVTLKIEAASKSGFRGEAVRVRGRATPAEGSPSPAGLRIDVYLAPAGAEGRGARVVGRTVTDEEGRFEAAVDLPPDLVLGTHEIFAVTPGTAEIGPAISD